MFQYKRSFDEDIKPLAKREDANVRAANVQSCIKYMNRMMRKQGFMWCATKLPRRLPEIFQYNVEKRDITLTEEASRGDWYLAKKGNAKKL